MPRSIRAKRQRKGPRFTYRGEDVLEGPEWACQDVGYSQTIRVDNGAEFVPRDLDLLAYQRESS